MRHDQLVSVLTALRQGRLRLVDDFRTEEPQLYRSMFLFDASSAEMDAAISRYRFHWLSEHPSVYQKLREGCGKTASTLEDDEFNMFLLAYRNLCSCFLGDAQGYSDDRSHLIDELVKESVSQLDRLLEISGRAEERLRRLTYQGEKSRNLFNRTFLQLKEKEGNENS